MAEDRSILLRQSGLECNYSRGDAEVALAGVVA